MTSLDWLTYAWRLKERPREGWRVRGVEEPESVAAHAWGTALLCLLFADDAGVDRAEAIEIALAHDLAEAEVGDLPSFADEAKRPVAPAEKARREAAAMAELASLWPDPATRRVDERWRAYEDRAGSAAVFVRDMNLLDMCLQAYLYARDGRARGGDVGATADASDDLSEFFASADARIVTQVGRRRFDELHAAFRALGTARGSVPEAGPS